MSAALSFLRLLKYLKDVIYEASLNHLQLVVHILAKYNLFLRKKRNNNNFRPKYETKIVNNF